MTDQINDLLAMEDETSLSTDLSEFLAFVSDGLDFAISTKYVTEIITNYQITLLPRVPSHIRGIINLRGQIIPVIDTRIRLRQNPSENRGEVCIIIINIDEVLMGLLVDNVSHVLNVSRNEILPPPVNNRQELVTGIVHVADASYLVIDCEKLPE